MQTISSAASGLLVTGGMAEPVVHVYEGSTKKATLSVTGGEVTCDRQAAVHRSCSVTLGGFEAIIPDLGALQYTTTYGDGPYGGGTYGDNVNRQIRGLVIPGVTELRLFWRLHTYVPFGPGDTRAAAFEDVPLGRFRVATAEFHHTAAGVECRVTGYDISRRIALAGYTVPHNIAPGGSLKAAVSALITDGVPGASVTFPAADEVTPRAAFLPVSGADRWADVKRLALVGGWEAYTTRTDGVEFRLADDPGTDPADYEVTYAKLVSAGTSLDDEQAVNIVVVHGQTAEGVPVRGYAERTTGQWGTQRAGKRVMYFESEHITTTAQANLVAAGLLRRNAGLTDTIEIETDPLPMLDPGDLVDVTDPVLDLDDLTYLVERVAFSLDPSQATRLTLSRRLA